MPTEQQNDHKTGSSRLSVAKNVLYNETLLITVTLLLSLGTVVALAVFIRFDDWGLNLFRILVITLFTILPAVMYYVFIASKKQSLFQEFVSNLNRLGLLVHREEESQHRGGIDNTYLKRTRILSYIDRFEAVYGPVGETQKNDLLRATVCSKPSSIDESKPELARGQIFSPATAVPVFIATFLIGLGWIQFIPPWIDGQPLENNGNATLHSALLYNELPALFAFLGAYFFSLQMLYRRYVTNDLRSSAFISVSIRIVLAVIGAWLLQVIFSMKLFALTEDIYWLLFASFVVGVFPPVVWRILRELSSKLLVLGKVLPSLDSDFPMDTLDGLTIWHQTRLEEEDIENGYNMASADIIALLINTKMPPERIIDWVDQAILYTCTGAPDRTQSPTNPSIATRLMHSGIANASSLIKAATTAYREKPISSSQPTNLQSIETLALVERVKGFSNLALIEHWRAEHADSSFSTGPYLKSLDHTKNREMLLTD